jgi:hypothetical protein
MTDDLIERLRRPNDGWCYGCWDDLPERAADRIEQLEAALRGKDNIAYVIDSHGMTHDTFTIVYRAALGEKTDG